MRVYLGVHFASIALKSTKTLSFNCSRQALNNGARRKAAQALAGAQSVSRFAAQRAFPTPFRFSSVSSTRGPTTSHNATYTSHNNGNINNNKNKNDDGPYFSGGRPPSRPCWVAGKDGRPDQGAIGASPSRQERYGCRHG